MSTDGYTSSAAMRRGIIDLAKNNGINPEQALKDVARSRILARLNMAESHLFVLKGGTAMQARVAEARSTRDIDLSVHLESIEAAANSFTAAMATDLEDFFRFEVTPRHDIEVQPGTQGRALHVECYLGATKIVVNIDLVVGTAMTGEPERMHVHLPFEVPGLAPVYAQVIATVDHIADKVCATAGLYGGGQRSTRTRDLVDVVILACTKRVNGTMLRTAINREWHHRRLPGDPTFDLPSFFRTNYTAIAATTNAVAGFHAFEDAATLAYAFILPAITGKVDGREWDPIEYQWNPIQRVAIH